MPPSFVSSQGTKNADGTADLSEKSPTGLPKRQLPNPISRLFWLWIADYVKLTNKNGQITAEDLPYVREKSETVKLNERFVENLFYVDKATNKKVQRSLKMALALTFRKPLMFTGCCSVVEIFSKLVTPILISRLLTWFEDSEATRGDGILLAVGLVCSTFIGQGLVWAHSAMVRRTGKEKRQ